MPDFVLPILLATVVVIGALALLRRRGANPLTAAFLTVADRRGWSRMAPAEANEVLAPFGKYLDDDGTVDLAVGGQTEQGWVTVAAIGVRDRVARGRPWYGRVPAGPGHPRDRARAPQRADGPGRGR